MIVQIDKSVYEMSCETFDKIVELILEKNSSRYFIYCLVRKGVYILTNDFFDDEKQFKELLGSYAEEGFDVYFVEEGVLYVKQAN